MRSEQSVNHQSARPRLRLRAVTMGCADECRLVLAKQRVDWQIPDPKNMTPEQFREVRNLIETKVKELIQLL